MNTEQRIKYLIDVNSMNYGEIHAAIDTLCRLIAEGKEVRIVPCDFVVYGETTPGFTVSAHDKNGDVWTSEPDTVLSDALSELWVSIPEVTK